MAAQPYTFRVLAGLPFTVGHADGAGADARFDGPGALTLDATGNAYVADTNNHVIRRVSASGVVTTIAGVAGSPGSADGLASEARFNQPRGIAMDPGGALYIADSGNHTVRKISPAGMVTTVVGLAGVPGSADGAGDSARFDHPWGIAVDRAGTIYVSDSYNHTIRIVTHPGVARTLAGLAGRPGAEDGQGDAARFYYPKGLALDDAGTLHVADSSLGRFRQVTTSGTVTTLANLFRSGTFCIPNCPAPGVSGCGVGCSLPWACGVSSVDVDAAATAYVVGDTLYGGVDCGIHAVTPAGVTRVAPSSGQPWHGAVSGIAVASDGVLWVADRSTIRRGFLDEDADTLPDAWERQVGLSARSREGADGPDGDPDDDGRTNAQEWADGTHPRGIHRSYLAEGAASDFFDTRICLLNPTVAAAHVLLRFVNTSGTVVPWMTQVGPLTRATIDAKGIPALGAAEFSTVVESDVPLVVDRTMTWGDDRRAWMDVALGTPASRRVYGAHSETAVAAPALTWHLAEGATHGAFNLFYLLQNPTETPARVRVTYLRPAPAGPVIKTYTVAPTSRLTIWVDYEGPDLANSDVSAVIEVTNDVPIIVERAMYAEVPGEYCDRDYWCTLADPFGAGHDSAGIREPALEWFLAEGATGPFFDLFVLIANPTGTPAEVEVTYLLPDGSTVVKRHTVAAASRFTIWVDHEYDDPRLASTAVSTTVRSTNEVPIIVERAMWWPDGSWHGAHNSAGATATGTLWAMAEGEVDAARHLETYVLIANTSVTPAEVRVTLLFEDGTSAERAFGGADIPGRSRFNVPVGFHFPEADGRRFGVLVESVGDIPAAIVVERATYWDAAGQSWAAGANALATKLR